MKIHLPNSAFLGNIDPFLDSFDPTDPTSLEITANEKWISIHPVILSMVASIGQSIEDKAKINCEEFQATSKHYLERMGLFKFLSVDSGMNIVEHESAGRFIPLTKITKSEQLTTFITNMIPLLHLELEQTEPIKYVISELVRNVLEHAQTQQGAMVCAQYYKDSNTIRIGVADCGVGIYETMRTHHPVSDDMEAMRLALKPGVTGTTSKEGGTELNAGAGLFFIKSIAKVNRDFFVIYSGSAMYKLLKTSGKSKKIYLYSNPFEDRCSKKDSLPKLSGTVVGIDISLDRNQAFDVLLDLIRDTYFERIREKRKKKFKKAKFI